MLRELGVSPSLKDSPKPLSYIRGKIGGYWWLKNFLNDLAIL